MARVLHDKFFKLAKAQGFVARSAYKLEEIQAKHGVIAKGSRVLDLGCHPGAWLQVACKALGGNLNKGLVLGVDLQVTDPPKSYCDSRVRTLRADVRHCTPEMLQRFSPEGFHVVLSDMCHETTGNSMADAAQSLALAEVAVRLAIGPVDQHLSKDDGLVTNGVLRPGGNIVVKLLQGAGTEELGKALRTSFATVSFMQPQATRRESREIYVIAKSRR